MLVIATAQHQGIKKTPSVDVLTQRLYSLGSTTNEHQPKRQMPCPLSRILYLKLIHIRTVAALSESVSLAFISKLVVLTAPTALMSRLHRGEGFLIFLSANAYVET